MTRKTTQCSTLNVHAASNQQSHKRIRVKKTIQGALYKNCKKNHTQYKHEHITMKSLIA